MASVRRRRLRARVDSWAAQLGVAPRVVRIQSMTRKWGSCSTGGVVTLAADLARRPVAFQDYVVVHELLHLRVPNHSRLFKALMSVHVPDWKRYEASAVARSHTVHRSRRPV
jgi:predicted metal-dependent hydrolase